jgi:hypothetical protein
LSNCCRNNFYYKESTVQIIAILIGLVLLAAIAFYVSRPIVQQRRGGTDATVMATLEAHRDAVYSQIRELDMDHATGKMNDEDYQQARTDLVAQAAALLKQIDGVLAAPIVPASIAVATLPAADDIEALIAARRKAPAQPAAAVKPAAIQSDGDTVEAAIAARRKQVAVASPPDDVEALIAARRKSAAKPAVDDIEAAIAARRKSTAPAPMSTAPLPTAAACPTCGKVITPDDVFCSKCGTPLKAAAR